MAQKRPFTPEKQLLKLIEDQDAAKTSNVKRQTIKHHRKQLFSLRGWISRFSFSKDRLKKWLTERRTHQPDVKTINRILALSVFVLCIYFAANLYLLIINLERPPGLEVESASDKTIAESSTILSSLRDKVSYYLEKVKQIDPLFKCMLRL